MNSFSLKAQHLKAFVKDIPTNSFLYDPKLPEKKQVDWKLFWMKCSQFAPEISALAVGLLSIGVSEAAVERSFSAQQFIHSRTRNRLESDVLENEMRIRFNSFPHSQENITNSIGIHCEDIEDDEDEKDDMLEAE